MKDFRIRSYGRTELAMLYCPDPISRGWPPTARCTGGWNAVPD